MSSFENTGNEIRENQESNIVIDSLKRKRKSYTLDEKSRVAIRVEGGESIHIVAEDTGIDRNSIRLWIKQKSDIQSASKRRIVRRLEGRGIKALNPEVDAALLDYFKDQRTQRRAVTSKMLQNYLWSKAFPVALNEAFSVSSKFIYNWTRRTKISYTKITHHGQEDRRSREDIKNSCIDFFDICSAATIGKYAARLYNMDKVPCYIDMSRDCTLHFRGAKNVEGADTGYRKQRYTVRLFVSLEEKMLLPFLIFRGRERAPKISSVHS
jgi:CENP-B N-terminal DNA-binding domain/Tc5 transposase DNA-binding domain